MLGASLRTRLRKTLKDVLGLRLSTPAHELEAELDEAEQLDEVGLDEPQGEVELES
jgi:hypothetical protein